MSVHNVTLAMALLEPGLVTLPQESALRLRVQRLIGVHSGVHEDSILIHIDRRQLRDELQVSRRQSSEVGRVCRVEAIRSKRLGAPVLHPPLMFCLAEAGRQHHHLVISLQDNQPRMAIRPVHDELKYVCALWAAVDVVAQCDNFCLPTPPMVDDPTHGQFEQICAAVDIRNRICKFNTSHCCTVSQSKCRFGWSTKRFAERQVQPAHPVKAYSIRSRGHRPSAPWNSKSKPNVNL